jgi:hypothetical protein
MMSTETQAMSASMCLAAGSDCGSKETSRGGTKEELVF